MTDNNRAEDRQRLVLTEDELRAAPKAELHCHLDGSLPRTYFEERLGRPVAPAELEAPADCADLRSYLKVFDLPLATLQDEESLFRAGYAFMENCAAEHVVYTEPRFAPLPLREKGLSTEQVIEAVLAGLAKGGDEFGIAWGVIVCAMRHHSEEDNRALFQTAARFLGRGVVAVDLAGDEAAWPMEHFRGLFREAAALGLPYTIHAGECGDARNVRDAVLCGARRIGHGVAVRRGHGSAEEEDEKARVRELLAEREVTLELCPISNLQTHGVELTDGLVYPVRELMNDGVRVTVNTDNRTVSGTSLTREFCYLQQEAGLSAADFRNLQEAAVRASFADDGTKARLLREIAAARP